MNFVFSLSGIGVVPGALPPAPHLFFVYSLNIPATGITKAGGQDEDTDSLKALPSFFSFLSISLFSLGWAMGKVLAWPKRFL